VEQNDTAVGNPSMRHEHSVQFYETEAFLAELVADFLAPGAEAGDPTVVIATPEHQQAFSEALRSKGLDGAGGVTFLDAREMLSRFMVGDLPDAERFQSSVGSLIAQSCGSGRKVRAYGEMVDLLWRDGNPDAALRLEELWNDLAAVETFSLLCAYPMGNFYKESDARFLEDVCRRHTHSAPAESYSRLATEAARATEIALLQQRTAVLQAELEHRKELELALRESLSARRAAEEELRRSERELKDFVENATVGLHWVDASGTILWANAAELDLLGYERDEYVGRPIADFHADAAVIADILRRLAANQEIRDYEARLVAKDGSIKRVAINSNVLFKDGKFVHTRCFTRDITEQKRLEEERAFLLDVTTILNRSLEYETRLDELASLLVPRLADWCAVDIARADGACDRVSAAPADPQQQLPRRLEPAHPIRPLLAASQMIVPMSIGDRVLGALTLISFDAARTYSEVDFALATEIGRRAAIAIENARLYQLAQDANRAKDQFLATLSHELRTPLTAILGWARMLTLGGLDADTMQTALSTIERSARTQAAIIDDLLDLSRVVTGKLALQNDLVDLGTVVAAAVETVRLSADAKSIHIDVYSGPGRSVVSGDSTRLQQVVWNLLSNAIKFSEKGQVSVTIGSRDDQATITVKDHGRGISANFLPHVFEPFRQADGASTRAYGGLGLGLAIVKYLTELHGGTVTVSSPGENEGASFTVSLPLASKRSAHPIAPSPHKVDLGAIRVLVVDDDADTCNLIAASLRRCGATVAIARSVEGAREQLTADRPDVIVTDIALPGEDGFALLRHLQSGPEPLRGIPVIALTASAGPAARKDLELAGFCAHVKKPIDPLRFAELVGRVRNDAATN
jgi:PAS domain S-box-containing protein